MGLLTAMHAWCRPAPQPAKAAPAQVRRNRSATPVLDYDDDGGLTEQLDRSEVPLQHLLVTWLPAPFHGIVCRGHLCSLPRWPGSARRCLTACQWLLPSLAPGQHGAPMSRL